MIKFPLWLLCGPISLALSAAPVVAQNEDVPAPLPPTGTPRPGARPPFIAFDEATARDYLARIDEPRNAVSLQMGLFMSRRSAIAPDQAINLITEQMAKETPGSRRWALLNNLIGFGGFNAPGFNAEANAAYKRLFSASPTPETAPVVESALRTYVSSVASTGLRRGDSSSTPDVMVAALGAYLSLPVLPPATPGVATPRADTTATGEGGTTPPTAKMSRTSLPWGDAIGNTGSGPALAKDIENRLKDPALAGEARLRVLQAGAEVQENFDVERSVELIQEAAPLAAKFAPDDTLFTDLQVRLLSANNKLPEAIAAQKAAILRTGKGRANLLKLQARSGDTAGLNATIDELKRANADTGDVLAAVASLQNLSGIAGLDGRQLAREVAESYLNAPRERTPESEMVMKMSLARLLYRSGDKDGAIKLLQTIPTIENGDQANQRTSRGLANMLKQMQDGTYNTGA